MPPGVFRAVIGEDQFEIAHATIFRVLTLIGIIEVTFRLYPHHQFNGVRGEPECTWSDILFGFRGIPVETRRFLSNCARKHPRAQKQMESWIQENRFCPSFSGTFHGFLAYQHLSGDLFWVQFQVKSSRCKS